MTEDGPIQVLIVGGGISGLTVAAALIDAGIEPIVIESAETLDEGTSPAVVELWPGALSLLDELGVADDIHDASTAVDTWTQRASNGSVTHRREADGVGLITVSYERLRDRLYRALPSRVVQTGRTVRSVERKADRALDDCGTRTWTVPVPSWSREGETAEVWTTAGVVFRVLPTRHGGVGRVTLPTEAVPKASSGRRAVTDLDDAQSAVEWLLPAALKNARTDQIRGGSDERLPTPVWGGRRIALVGDAAHARSRLTGIGPTLAIEDAASLATALSGSEEPIRNRVAAYAARGRVRFDRLERSAADAPPFPGPKTAGFDRYRSAAKVRAAKVNAHFTDRRDP